MVVGGSGGGGGVVNYIHPRMGLSRRGNSLGYTLQY